jgi:hypothetical protein
MERVNFADPDFEPTDEQLEALMTEAFAGVKIANDKALQEIHRQIAEARRKAASSQ